MKAMDVPVVSAFLELDLIWIHTWCCVRIDTQIRQLTIILVLNRKGDMKQKASKQLTANYKNFQSGLINHGSSYVNDALQSY